MNTGIIRDVLKRFSLTFLTPPRSLVDIVFGPLAVEAIPRAHQQYSSALVKNFRPREAYRELVMLARASDGKDRPLRDLMEKRPGEPDAAPYPGNEYIMCFYDDKGHPEVRDAIENGKLQLGYQVIAPSFPSLFSLPGEVCVYKWQHENYEFVVVDKQEFADYRRAHRGSSPTSSIENVVRNTGTRSLYRRINITVQAGAGLNKRASSDSEILVRRVHKAAGPPEAAAGENLLEIHTDGDSGISQTGHFRIFAEGGQVFFEHLAASSGCEVDGRIVYEPGRRIPVDENRPMEVAVGEFAFRVRLGAKKMAAHGFSGAPPAAGPPAPAEPCASETVRPSPVGESTAQVMLKALDLRSGNQLVLLSPKGYLVKEGALTSLVPGNGHVPENALAALELMESDVFLEAKTEIVGKGGKMAEGDRVAIGESSRFQFPDGRIVTFWIEGRKGDE